MARGAFAKRGANWYYHELAIVTQNIWQRSGERHPVIFPRCLPPYDRYRTRDLMAIQEETAGNSAGNSRENGALAEGSRSRLRKRWASVGQSMLTLANHFSHATVPHVIQASSSCRRGATITMESALETWTNGEPGTLVTNASCENILRLLRGWRGGPTQRSIWQHTEGLSRISCSSFFSSCQTPRQHWGLAGSRDTSPFLRCLAHG